MSADSTQPVARVNPADVPIRPTPIDPSSILNGTPHSGWSLIAGPPGIDIGVWGHSVGVSSDIEEDEAFVVASGSATVVLDGGRSYDFGPGDIGVLRAGARTTWIVHETFRKVFVTLAVDDD